MTTTGRYTGCDLCSAEIMAMPWVDCGGQLRPQFSRDAALLSLELAATSYNLEMEAWRNAGWHDISYQVDNTLLTGTQVNPASGHGLTNMIGDYLAYLAQSRLKRANPISQLRGALRQKEGSDTCKAIVMIHALSGGRYVVAIGFMGTGKRIYDWFSNFRLSADEGMHAGFLQLTKRFEMNLDAICFPETAKELGLEQLTLRGILDECHRPGSRFRIWMAGHSQGGAVMQLFAYREVMRGFLRQNMIGYGFASPSAVYDPPCCDIASFPLYHIINADDIFPRMGAALHLGRCRVFTPDDSMRSLCYRACWQDGLFREMLQLTRRVCSSADAFLFTLSFLLALKDLPEEEAMNALNSLLGNLMPDVILGAIGSRRENLLQGLIGRVRRGYARLPGSQDAPEAFLLPLRNRMAGIISQYGAKAFTKAFLSALGQPHKLHGDPIGPYEAWLSSYQYITLCCFPELKQKIWCEPAIRMHCHPVRTSRAIQAGRFATLSKEKTMRAARPASRRIS